MPAIEPAPEKAQPLLRVIVEAIWRRRIRKGEPASFPAYSDALEWMGVPPCGRAGQQIKRHGLTELNEWTTAHEELPKIEGLIVNKASRRPSAGFAESHGRGDDPNWEAWWLNEANRAIDYDWRPFLVPVTRYSTNLQDAGPLVAREDGGPEAPDYRGIITLEPGKRGGRPCIRGMRITVGDILGWLAAGMSAKEITKDFPELTVADIHAALAFAADRERHTVSMAASHE